MLFLKNRKKTLLCIGLICMIQMITPDVIYGGGIANASGSSDTNAYANDPLVSGMSREGLYSGYLLQHSDKASPIVVNEVDIFDLSNSKNAEIIDNIEGSRAVLSNEDGYLDYEVNIAEEGLYNIYVEYYPIEGKGIDIERALYINGEIPFFGAELLTLSRVWGNKTDITQDNRGNDIRPSQIEKPSWQSAYFKDYMGYFTEPYQFYFSKGKNTIKLEAINEPLLIRKLSVKNTQDMLDYSDFIATVNSADFSNTQSGFLSIVQGEDAILRSSPTLYPSFDRSSPNTEPYSASLIKLNMIGSNQWRVPGQWIEWEVEVPEDGMYNISIKSRQNYNRGFVSNRKLLVNGELLFNEVSAIPFKYNNNWELVTLGNSDGEAFLFPLSKGSNRLRLEITLGDIGALLNKAEESVYRLNAVYRKIIILTGTEPDRYRDYQIEKVYPEVIEVMRQESIILAELVDSLVAYAGQRASQVAAANTLSRQLALFVERPELIPLRLNNFKSNIGSLGTFILTTRESPLDIDYIAVSAPDAVLPVVKAGVFTKAAHEIRMFLSSFFTDYSSIGNVYDSQSDPVEVWILSGRDQTQVIKSMIDDTYTPSTGNSVNVRLITADVLLPSVVAGTGPDIALQVGSAEPVDYALRNAAIDLSVFEGFEQVKTDYYESAFVPFEFQGGYYALPETQNFPVLFYRKDVLEELGIEIPHTWEELIKVLPAIQKNNMNFGLEPANMSTASGVSATNISSYLAQLYQRGGTLYSEDGSEVLIDNSIGVESFEFFTKMYNNYKLPVVYDFVNRFRTGEMPMGVADYSTYNTLSVFAPEIRGLWDFAPIPGTVNENGEINKAAASTGSCSMMVSTVDDKQKAWEFMQWWVNSETQLRFGREMESLLGASARYATANKNAFEQLAWSSANKSTIKEQWEWIQGTPNVPGGYFTSRHIVNAFRRVINAKEDPRETLLDYTKTINDELLKKRKEFGLTDR